MMKWLCASVIAIASFAAPALAADKLRVGTPDAAGFPYAPIDVGVETGIFAKHGLDVQRIDFGGGAKVHLAMAAGELDMVVGAGTDLLFVARGSPERAVAADGNILNALGLLVRFDDPAKTVDDLKGKAVGVTTAGSFTNWLARAISIKHGWGPDGFKLAYLGQMNSVVAGLMAKNVDAIVGSTADGLQLEKEQRARIVAMGGEEIQDFIANMIFASGPMMTNHPDQVRAFLAGWFETIRFIKSNRAEATRIANKTMKVADDVAAKMYDVHEPGFFTDGRFDRKKLAAVKQALIDIGAIQAVPPDDQLIDEKFLP